MQLLKDVTDVFWYILSTGSYSLYSKFDKVKSMILRPDFSMASAIERDWDRCPPDDKHYFEISMISLVNYSGHSFKILGRRMTANELQVIL
jgi:hypothetical protein